MRIRLVALALILVNATLLLAQGLPLDLPNRDRILAYVKAFNAGDDAMSAFFKENTSDAALQRRGVADRV